MDIWIDRSEENADRVFRALARFGAPLANLSSLDFAEPEIVFQVGVEPLRIDILTDVSGLLFSDAWGHRETSTYGDVPVNLIARSDYIKNKRASGRPSDLRDVAALLEESG